MDSVTWIRMAWALKEAGHKVEDIAGRVGMDRATAYRWFRGIRQLGIHGFVGRYRDAKKGHRHRKTSSDGEQRVLAIRREHHGSCGEKIVYGLAQEDIRVSRSTVYRILNKHLRLTVKGRKNVTRGRLPQANGPRQVVQMDTIDFGRVDGQQAIILHARGRLMSRPYARVQPMRCFS